MQVYSMGSNLLSLVVHVKEVIMAIDSIRVVTLEALFKVL